LDKALGFIWVKLNSTERGYLHLGKTSPFQNNLAIVGFEYNDKDVFDSEDNIIENLCAKSNGNINTLDTA
jgi:hypothetical protein